MAAEESKEKQLEDKVNELLSKNKTLEDENKNVKNELQWLTEKYNELLNASFSEIFDIAAKIKNASLFKLLEKRNSEQQPSQ